MNKLNLQIVPFKQWVNTKTGQTVSRFSVPYVNDNDKKNWILIEQGFTVYNEKTGTYGIGRKPFETMKEAMEFLKN